MTEVLQKSDFALKVSFIDLFGQSISLKKFKFSYSTQLSTPIVASFDGQNYSSNCIAQSDGVLILFRNPLLNTGRLKVHRQYTTESLTFTDGERHINQVEMLPIEIVCAYSRQKQIPTPINVTSSQEDLVVIDQVVVEAIQGPKGEISSGRDYTLLGEQKLDGQYWFGEDSTGKAQLYSQTVVGSFPNLVAGAMGVHGYIYSVEGMVDCYSITYKEGVYVNNSPAKFRDAGALGIYYDIPASLFGAKYKLTFTYAR